MEASRSLLDSSSLRPEGTVLVLLARTADRQWAADTAVDLSARWARAGRRIVLADLHLENPLLHFGLDVSNLEGVVDIFLYGASLARIAKPVRDGSFYLIPAGTYAPDVDEIYRHPRWKKLVAGFRDTDATLILFAPAEGTDLEALSKWSSEAIILGSSPDRALRGRVERAGLRVLAEIDAPGQPQEAMAAPVAAPAFDETAEVETTVHSPAPVEPNPVADPRSTGRAKPVQVHRPPESELELPPPLVRKKREKKTVSIFLWVIFFLILLATVGYLVATIRPDLIQGVLGSRSAAPSAETVAPVQAAQAPQPLGELLPYSVQVRAFTSLSAARDEIATDQARLETVPFFISPEEIQGILYYKILSGMAADTTAAIALRDRLVEIGSIDEEDAVGAWSMIQFTPLAFELGSYQTPAEAAARSDSLLAREIPTYTARVPYTDGTSRYQLYAGAFPDSVAALGLRRMLEAAGIEAPLSARTGAPAILTE